MSRLEDRREKLRRHLLSGNADSFLVTSPTNVRYLTGFTGDSSVLVITKNREIIVSDGRFTAQLAQECPGLETAIRPMGRELNQEVSRVVDLLGPRNLAFESATCTVAEYESLRHALPTVSMVAVSGWVEAIRRVKDEFEISEIREAIRSAERRSPWCARG